MSFWYRLATVAFAVVNSSTSSQPPPGQPTLRSRRMVMSYVPDRLSSTLTSLVGTCSTPERPTPVMDWATVAMFSVSVGGKEGRD
jgi:hypothetical protein